MHSCNNNMRYGIIATLVFFTFAPAALAATVCDTDNYTLAQCQANCTGTWDSSNSTCSGTISSGIQSGPGGSNRIQTGPGGGNVTLINPLNSGSCAPNENCLLNFLNKILEFVVIRIGTVVVILMLVYVGYLFVVAQGSDTKITEARKALLWTIVGALILLGSQAIAVAIRATVQALSVGQ